MDWYNLIKAIILGIVEGVTEWLPISSTGHLILVQEFMKLDARPEFIEMFNVVVQLGAIIAVILIYFNKLNPFSPKKTATEKKDTWNLWFKVLVGCLPAGVLGLMFDDFLDEHFHKFLPIALMLIIYGVLFIIVENRNKDREPSITSFQDFTYKSALIIGFFQVLALMPGTSRSGATIIGALLIGTSRFVATEFSFFLSIPVMIGASGYKMLKFLKIGGAFTGDELMILIVGSVVAFVVSLIVIKFLLNYIKTNDFKPFGWYRIILGVILIGYWTMTHL
ncbi:undecaprenyl-diphosphate phosphatase [Vagococcus lutrae]|uniref:undecaprenyl-diphosphate phosphatase n=1 Tax=Vagococcus lutrae TaxID=81947 RepID=UPI002097BC97|nr:undecaprenyl-diphosphate phosphatase [Vagococcus lutrae]MCO7150735.1 undecaprenyl-diphosphate phosphatase [Vagococcus lutrae]MDT2801685.1 undecaprenyl-diphosphate phosphatase [Vagococcus lutrae]MDT2807897.1 undecaprenyl-diphosphate phosphatase [Vagococcus lutrae]MDT2812075.1 undecaprenyl-diphosphate phosphatase [Vagococcus lutrae]MDT2818947.1 undecaprenyl-diphosphate phosphatase [Vagococcus lutrae]